MHDQQISHQIVNTSKELRGSSLKEELGKFSSTKQAADYFGQYANIVELGKGLARKELCI